MGGGCFTPLKKVEHLLMYDVGVNKNNTKVSVNSGPEKAHRTAICGSPVFPIQ